MAIQNAKTETIRKKKLEQEKELQEEEEAIQSDPKIRVWLDLVRYETTTNSTIPLFDNQCSRL